MVLIDIKAMVPSLDFCHETFLSSQCLAWCLSKLALRWSAQIIVLDNVLDNIIVPCCLQRSIQILDHHFRVWPLFCLFFVFCFWLSLSAVPLMWLPAVLQMHPTIYHPCILGSSCCFCLKCPCLYAWWIFTHLSRVSSGICSSANPFQPLPIFY